MAEGVPRRVGQRNPDLRRQRLPLHAGGFRGVGAVPGRMPSAVGYQPTLSTEMGELQERITSTSKGAITSVQAIYVPRRPHRPRPSDGLRPPDAFVVLARGIAEKGIFPRPTPSPRPPPSRILCPPTSSASVTTSVSPRVQSILPLERNPGHHRDSGVDELSEEGQEDRQPSRPQDPSDRRPSSQPFYVAEVFTGFPARHQLAGARRSIDPSSVSSATARATTSPKGRAQLPCTSAHWTTMPARRPRR